MRHRTSLDVQQFGVAMQATLANMIAGTRAAPTSSSSSSSGDGDKLRSMSTYDDDDEDLPLYQSMASEKVSKSDAAADLLANMELAGATNAITDIDHAKAIVVQVRSVELTAAQTSKIFLRCSLRSSVGGAVVWRDYALNQRHVPPLGYCCVNLLC